VFVAGAVSLGLRLRLRRASRPARSSVIMSILVDRQAMPFGLPRTLPCDGSWQDAFSG